MSFSVMLLVLLGAALHATWNALVKSGSDRGLDMAAVVTGSAVLALPCLFFLPLPNRAAWPYIAASVLIHQVYFTLIALSYRKGDMSLVYPVTRGAAPALTALLAATMLHERPSPGGWTGTLLVSGGVLLLAFDNRRSAHFEAAPFVFALMNAGIVVLYTLVDGVGARLSGHAFSYTAWGFLLSALLFTSALLSLRGRAAVAYLRQQRRRGLIGGACSMASYSLALWAMTRAPIASVAALREISVIFGVLIAVVTLKEQVTRIRFAAIAIVVVGAALIKML
jgi:drug/metabolite transporter (DMT)-like permease